MPPDYVAPRWLPGGNPQTIWPALFGRRSEGPLPAYRRERWNKRLYQWLIFLDIEAVCIFVAYNVYRSCRRLLIINHYALSISLK